MDRPICVSLASIACALALACGPKAEPDVEPAVEPVFELRDRAGRRCATVDEVFALPAEDLDLGTAALLLCREVNPDVDVETLSGALDAMARAVGRVARRGARRETLVALIRTVGLPRTYVRDERLVDRVLRANEGNCVSLSMAYLAVAERAGVPLRGVLVPYHFYVVLPHEEGTVAIETTTNEYVEGLDGLQSWFFTERDRTSGMQGRGLDARECVALYAVEVADLLLDEGQSPSRALELCELAEAWAPASARLQGTAAVALARLGRRAEAEARSRRALELRPDDADGWSDAARRRLGAGRPDEAAEAIARALEIDPKFPPYWLVRAEVAQARGAWREVVEACERALAIHTVQLHPTRRMALEELHPDPESFESEVYALRGAAYLQEALERLDAARAHGASRANANLSSTARRFAAARDRAQRGMLLAELCTSIAAGLSGQQERARSVLAQVEASLAEGGPPATDDGDELEELLARARDVCARGAGD